MCVHVPLGRPRTEKGHLFYGGRETELVGTEAENVMLNIANFHSIVYPERPNGRGEQLSDLDNAVGRSLRRLTAPKTKMGRVCHHISGPIGLQ